MSNRIEELADALENLMPDGKFIEKINRSGRGELFILKYLYEKNIPVTPSELSEALQSSTARISAVLGNLEKKGQIYREVDTSNRRNILVTITDEGRKHIRIFREEMRKHMIAVLTEVGEQDAAEFIRIAKKFLGVLQRTMHDMPVCEDHPLEK